MSKIGNLLKINIYAEIKKKKGKELGLENFEKGISKYRNWLRKTIREDKIESYEEFLQVQK